MESGSINRQVIAPAEGEMKGIAGVKSLLIPGLLSVFLVILLKRAWLCDDAFITFRTVDNFINGYRLTWNITERVQAYTHPLWMLLVSCFYFFTHEIYFTSLALSIFISLLALGLLARFLALSEAAAAFSIFVLLLSKAYVDFSTSGLENPLSHLLLVSFFILFFKNPPFPRKIFWLSLIASLGMTTRMDLALVFLPALVFTWWQARNKKALWSLLAGQIPFLAWELFSIIYYGFPFPNTAYAKLNTGIATSDYIRQGVMYLLNSVQFDSLTPIVIVLGLSTLFFNRDRRVIFLGLGCIFYLAYIVEVGGDFMSGRFLTVPLLCAVLMLVRADFSRLSVPATLVLYAVALVVGLNVVNPTVRINDLGPIDSGPIHQWDNGILDERMLYYGGTGLLNTQRDIPMPTFYWGIDGEKARTLQQKVAENYGIGMFAFNAGPQVYVLDKLALADPLLARLPAFRKVDWRIGHFERSMPPGYLQTLQLGRNMISDPNLAQYYDKLVLITRGSLLSPQRLVEIWKMNTGQYDYLINKDAYRYPDLKRVAYADVSTPSASLITCDSPEVVVMQDSGIEVNIGEVSHAAWLEVGLDHNDRYQAVFFQGSNRLASKDIPTAYLPDPGGISVRILAIPPAAVSAGFDRLRIVPLAGDKPYCLGYLVFK